MMPAGHAARNSAAAERAVPVGRIGAVLAGLDPITTPPDHDVIAAVVLFLHAGGGSRELRLLWARYAYHGAERLAGTNHPLWLRAAQLYREVLTEQQLTVDAVRVCERRLAVYRRRRDPALVLINQAVLGTALHLDGQCERAEQQVTDALTVWAAGRRDARPGTTVLLSAAAVRAGCGNTQAATALLREHAGCLARLGEARRHAAATLLARTVRAHPPCCELPHPPANGNRERRQAFWRCHLTPSPARRSPAHRSGEPATATRGRTR
jgi:hypothetical protein